MENEVDVNVSSSEGHTFSEISLSHDNVNTISKPSHYLQSDNSASISEPFEQKTRLIQMTSSPSLSALAGILNEKTKHADMMIRKLSTNLVEEPIQEDEQDSSEIHTETDDKYISDLGSPNLIDLADNDEAVVFKHPIPLQESLEQPDFLSTPRVRQGSTNNSTETTPINTPINNPINDNESVVKHSIIHEETLPQESFEKTASKPKYNPFVDKNNSAIVNKPEIHETALSKLPVNEPEIPQEINNNISVPKPNPQEVSEQKTENVKTKRRRSLLNFWRKPKSTTEKTITSSHSFNLGGNSSEHTLSSGGDVDKSTAKRSMSSTSIFGNFRKNKHNSINTRTKTDHPMDPQPLPKNTNKLHDPNNSSQKRKPTPLDFEKALPEIKLEEKFPIDVFPKSLDASEVESIVSLERSRSIKSNQRNSISSLRTRSLSDHISLNAKMEGMFITDASKTPLATPDLTKSPVNSILRNGRFESPYEEMRSRSSNSLEEDSANVKVTSFSEEKRDFSFGSIEQKLNELTMEFDEEEVNDKTSIANATFNSNTVVSDHDDNELISDIMEFASIIDFGQDIELNFELNASENSKYETLNPVGKISSNSLLKPGLNSDAADSFFNEVNSFSDKSDVSQSKTTEFIKDREPKAVSSISEVQNINPQEAITKADSVRFKHTSNLDSNDEEDFENEDFNNIRTNKESPKISAFMPEVTNSMSRPISMSFRGLEAPQFNSNMDISALGGFQDPQDNFSNFSDQRSKFSSKLVTFSSQIVLYETYGELEYDRHPDLATCNQLTPQLAQMIKEELNELKAEMEIHEDSKCYTHFF